MKETRKLYREDLRNLCIRKSWYTRGGNEAYAELLETADTLENVKSENIVEIAKNILKHSDTEHTLSSICFEVAKTCNSFFE